MNDISRVGARHPDVLYGPSNQTLLKDEILADLLEATARRAPDQMALIDGERNSRYRGTRRARPAWPHRA